MEVFDLSKDDRFNLTGELIIEIIDEIQNYKLVAIHPNRTIEWTSDYSSIEAKTLHSSKIELAKDVWFGYKVEILNHTETDCESQEIILKISYPARDVSIGGLYISEENSFETDLNIEWKKNPMMEDTENLEEDNNVVAEASVPENLRVSFRWEDLEKNENSKDHQKVILALHHPSFEKNVTLEVCLFVL